MTDSAGLFVAQRFESAIEWQWRGGDTPPYCFVGAAVYTLFAIFHCPSTFSRTK